MTDYIFEPLDTDQEAIFQSFVEFVQTYFPDWQPSDGQLDVIIGRFFSMQIAFTADMASSVQRAIYRYFGASLCNIPPLFGSAATATIRFYTQDNDLTNILEYGSYVNLRDSTGDPFTFRTLSDLIVAPHSTTGTVEAQALDLGVAANNLTGTVELVEMVDWVDSQEVDGASSGGSDPEEDDVYIARLTTNLALMAPRPIIANDFALISQNVPGVWRAAALDNFTPGVNEQQTITSDRTTGTFKLKFSTADYGADLVPAATAVQIKAALAALSTIDDRDMIVTGGPLGTAPVVIEFTGQYSMQDVPLIVADTTSLTGGTAFTITQTTASTAWEATAANTVAISAVDEAGNRVSDTVRDNLLAYLNALRGQNFIIIYVEPSYNLVDIDYDGVSLPTADAAAVESSVNGNLTAYFDPAIWGRPENFRGDISLRELTREWVVPQSPTDYKVRYLDITTVVENTLGYDYTTDLDFAVAGSAMDKNDKSFKGPFPLARIGTIGGGGVAQG